ncbi:MAG TPA: resolvase [Moraxellaceae bacterium]|nr:resolvase [Moraxellaceae bacterium]
MSTSPRYIAYYRVSTAQQGRSGLGLEAQKQAVSAFLSSNGGISLAEYLEIESGRKRDRTELLKAIGHARAAKAILIIAKLDRLARNVSFTASLMESGLEFVACDMPHANRFTVHLMAALAEMEAEMISTRTKAALAEAKRRGVKLGNPRLDEFRGNPEKARESLVYQSDKRAMTYLGLVKEAINSGCRTFQAIGDYLSSQGVVGPRGGQWHPTSVKRLLMRLEESKAIPTSDQLAL